VTLDESALQAWGRILGETVSPPLFLALSGELGAGKSVLARAIARGAGVHGTLPSPTFNLMFRYPADRGVDVVHLDLYRLERPDQVRELGWRELGGMDEIVIVEWPERAAALLPADRWDVRLEHAGAELRRLSAVAHGAVPPLPPLPGGAD
jgi:tRNA threonylcarbamoyladenosine biosynthesis protein TsaE